MSNTGLTLFKWDSYAEKQYWSLSKQLMDVMNANALLVRFIENIDGLGLEYGSVEEKPLIDRTDWKFTSDRGYWKFISISELFSLKSKYIKNMILVLEWESHAENQYELLLNNE